MGTVRTDEFRKVAVRIAVTIGLSRRQISDDLGVGMSTQTTWITAHRDTDVVSHDNHELALENERCCQTNANSSLFALPVMSVRRRKARATQQERRRGWPCSLIAKRAHAPG